MDTQRKKILIIDDEVQFGQLLKMNLDGVTEGAMTYEGLVAANGREGLALIQRERPDLVLLDMMMPGMNGLETLKQIKLMSPELPVAMVTAVWNEDEGKRCFAAGAYEYITKPVDFEHLKTALLVKLFS